MNNIQIEIGGKLFTFAVKIEQDGDAGTPWEKSEGHGVVSEWETRDKRAGELVLNTDRGSKRFYDFAETMKIARRDGWDAAPYGETGETKGQKAERATLADFEYLRSWCANEWAYVGVIVTLLDDNGNKTEVSDSLWSVEDRNGFAETTAREIADELAHGYGTVWTDTTRSTYAYFPTDKAA